MLELAEHVRGARAGLRLVSGMVLAMHHIQVACIARHGLASPFFEQLHARELVEQQLLIASITSEVGIFGDTRVQHLRASSVERRQLQARQGRDDGLVRRARRRPARDLPPHAGRAAERSGARAVRKGDYTLDADRHLGHARHARHVQPGLQDASRRARPSRSLPGSLRRRLGADDGAVLAHPVVGALARHRVRRVRPRRAVRPRRGAQEAGHGAADRARASPRSRSTLQAMRNNVARAAPHEFDADHASCRTAWTSSDRSAGR